MKSIYGVSTQTLHQISFRTPFCTVQFIIMDSWARGKSTSYTRINFLWVLLSVRLWLSLKTFVLQQSYKFWEGWDTRLLCRKLWASLAGTGSVCHAAEEMCLIRVQPSRVVNGSSGTINSRDFIASSDVFTDEACTLA